MNLEQIPGMPAPRNPNCLTACIESICLWKGWHTDLSLIHAHYGFLYLGMSSEHLNFSLENHRQHELKISTAWPYTFSRAGVSGDVFRRLECFYGISLDTEEIANPESTIDSILKIGELASVDPYYIQGRKEWNVRHGLIFVVVNGVDWNAGTIAILEQNVGQLYISIDDFIRSLHVAVDIQGYAHKYSLRKHVQSCEWSAHDLMACLRNTGSDKHAFECLAQLKAFERDYASVVESGAIPVVPAAWKCFGERYSFARYLRAVLEQVPVRARKATNALTAALDRCGAGWEIFSRFQTAVEASFDQRLLKRQITLLRVIVDDESRVAECIALANDALTTDDLRVGT